MNQLSSNPSPSPANRSSSPILSSSWAEPPGLTSARALSVSWLSLNTPQTHFIVPSHVGGHDELPVGPEVSGTVVTVTTQHLEVSTLTSGGSSQCFLTNSTDQPACSSSRTAARSNIPPLTWPAWLFSKHSCDASGHMTCSHMWVPAPISTGGHRGRCSAQADKFTEIHHYFTVKSHSLFCFEGGSVAAF